MGTEITAYKPLIYTEAELAQAESNLEITSRLDIFAGQLQELDHIGQAGGEVRFVYFPWNKVLLKCVDEASLFALRTNRNKHLVTEDEQKQLAGAVIGVAGMSVGAGIAIGSVYSGISSRIKIADHDVVDTSNLNRLRASLLDVGQPKTLLAARHIYELNPYANVDVFDKGVTPDTIVDFFNEPKLAVVFDEIDDFKMKVQLRLQARASGVPLIMLTSLGDNILVDIERYDLDPSLPLFHGLLPELSEEILAKQTISPEDIRRYSVQLVGQEYIPTRALQSVAEIGKNLVGRPQLYSTIAVDGGLGAYLVRSLILTGKPASGRYSIRFGELFGMPDDTADSAERTKVLEELFSNAQR